MSMCWRYWAVCPQLRQVLFKANRPNYVTVAVEKAAIKSAIYEHPEFAAFMASMNSHFASGSSAPRQRCGNCRLVAIQKKSSLRFPRTCSLTTPKPAGA